MTDVTGFGPAPAVALDRAFGESPLIGQLRIMPLPGSGRWRWSVASLGEQRSMRQGTTDGPVSLPYRYDTPGVHPIRIELSGSQGSVVIEELAIVHDQVTDLEVVSQRNLAEIPVDSPEGLAIDPQGEALYTAPYPAAEVLRLDAGTLEIVDRLSLPRFRVQGLAVTPSGGRLLSVHEKQGLSVIDLEAFEVMDIQAPGRGWVRAWDDEAALVTDYGAGTGDGLRRVGFVELRIEGTADGFIPGAFDFDRTRAFLAVVNNSTNAVDILETGALTRVRSISLDEFRPFYVAFDPTESVLYILADGDSEGDRFFLVEAASGNVLRSVALDPAEGGVISYNPSTTFSGGRYVALSYGSSVLIVDTQLDIPRYRLDPEEGENAFWSSVAAVPESDFLYVLTSPGGSIRRIRVR